MHNRNVNNSDLMTYDPVSPGLASLILFVVLVVASGLVSLFGVGANIVNIIVFVKQGFKDTINISLLGLAVADLMCVLSTFWMSFSCSPFFVEFDLNVNAYDLTYVTGSVSRVCANRITSIINTYIALERCLCIAFPLKIKTMITRRKAKAIIISIFFVVMILIFSPFYYINRLGWRYNQFINRTLLTLTFSSDRELIEPITFIIHSICLPVVCLVCIVFCTIILIVKLNQKSKWRQEASGTSASNPNMSSRKEQKVVKLVTFISTIFIICYLPATVIFVVMSFYPEFGVSGKYVNMYYVVWVITILLETVNSSVNIFVYVKMTSKFRQTFLVLFRFVKK